MTVIAIRKADDPVLRTVAYAITETDFQDGMVPELERDMRDTKRACDQGSARAIGLAAPQIGVSVRAILVGQDFMVNPVIVKRSVQLQPVREGCLSVDRALWNSIVMRSKRVEVEYQDTAGARRRIKAQGFMAACIQHEIDHLDGIIYTDYLAARPGSLYGHNLQDTPAEA